MSTIKDKVHFTYNGKSTRDFGILSANLDGGMYEESFVAEQSIREEKLVDRRTTIFSGIEKEPLEFQLVLAFENNFTDEIIDEVVDWLYGTEYYSKLEFEGIDRVYYCIPNGESTITHTGYKEGYITLNMRSNSPYVFGKMIEATKDNEIKNKAWSNSADGQVDFTKTPIKENKVCKDNIQVYGDSSVIEKSNYSKTNSLIYKKRVIDPYYGILFTAETLGVKPNTKYLFSYEYKVISGEISSFGGHTDMTFDNNRVYVDGVLRGSATKYSSSSSVWEKGVSDNGEFHRADIIIDTPNTVIKENRIYIQPNRGWVGDAIAEKDKMIEIEIKNIVFREISTNDDRKQIYLPSPLDNPDRYPLKYLGYSTNSDSDIASDYTWEKIILSDKKVFNIDLVGKVEPESIIKIHQKSNGFIQINMNNKSVRINNLLKGETVTILPNEEDISSDRINTYHYNDYIGDLSDLCLINRKTEMTVDGDCDIEYYYQPYYNK